MPPRKARKGSAGLKGEKGSAGVRNSVVAQEAVWRPSVRSRFPVGAQLRFRRSKRCCQARRSFSRRVHWRSSQGLFSGTPATARAGEVRQPVQAEGVLVSDLQGKGTPTGLAHQPEAVEVAEKPGTGAGRPAPQGEIVIVTPDQGSLGRCRSGAAWGRPQGQQDCGNYEPAFLTGPLDI